MVETSVMEFNVENDVYVLEEVGKDEVVRRCCSSFIVSCRCGWAIKEFTSFLVEYQENTDKI